MTHVRDIDRAVDLLRRGEVVAIPTETVYGLAADATNDKAVQKIFTAKGRPADHPLIVHISKDEPLDRWARDIPQEAASLVQVFWPGPLTILLKRTTFVSPAVVCGMDTIGLRCPAHPIARELLKQFGGGLAAPSANRFARISPTTASHVREELGDRVSFILDGGPCLVGLESTIVDLTSEAPSILRPGAITAEQIERVIGRELIERREDSPKVSGTLESHYAPTAIVELLEEDSLLERARELSNARGKFVVMAPFRLSDAFDRTEKCLEWIDFPDDMIENAQRLYASLRRADSLSPERILVARPRPTGIGVAILDRLQKSAAPRRCSS